MSEPGAGRYVVGKGGQRGYIPFGIETAKDADHFDLKEFWHMGRDLPGMVKGSLRRLYLNLNFETNLILRDRLRIRDLAPPAHPA